MVGRKYSWLALLARLHTLSLYSPGSCTPDVGEVVYSQAENKTISPSGMRRCGDTRLILRLRIDDPSNFQSTASTEYGEREESLAERGKLGVLSSHHDSVTLIVTVKL